MTLLRGLEIPSISAIYPHASAMIDTTAVDTTAINTPVVATMPDHRASWSHTARPVYATGAHESTRLSGSECKEASKQGSGENEALHLSVSLACQ